MTSVAGMTSMELRHRNLWLACGAAFVLFVIYESVTPAPLNAPTLEGFKSGHILAYFWITFWFAQIWRTPGQRATTAIAFTLMGIALEYVQRATGYRDFAYADMWDDGIGAAAGFAAAFTVLGRALGALDRRI